MSNREIKTLGIKTGGPVCRWLFWCGKVLSIDLFPMRHLHLPHRQGLVLDKIELPLDSGSRQQADARHYPLWDFSGDFSEIFFLPKTTEIESNALWVEKIMENQPFRVHGDILTSTAPPAPPAPAFVLTVSGVFQKHRMYRFCPLQVR